MLSRWLYRAIIACALAVLWPQAANAMHIAEGNLPLPWAGLWFAVAAPFVIWGLAVIRSRRAVQPRYMAMLAMTGSAVFLISCMPIPVPGTGSCSHPCGTGLAAALVGPAPTIVLTTVALLFQALFMAHGGLSTLGANIFSMGVLGAITGWGAFKIVRSLGGSPVLGAFAAGLVADWATYTGTAFALTMALHEDGSNWTTMFLAILGAFSYTQLPLGILEGLLSAGVYRFIARRRPELLAPSAALAGGNQ